MSSYKLPTKTFGFLTDGERAIFIKLLRDQSEEFSDADILEYFNRGHALLSERIARLKEADSGISPEEEKDLHFMIESLVYAKNILHRQG